MLDDGLAAARLATKAAYDEQMAAGGQSSAERSSVLVIRQLLSASDIQHVFEAAAASHVDQKVWPRRRLTPPGAPAHDVRYSGSHVALFLHCDRYLYKSWPALYATLVSGMRSHGTAAWGDAINSATPLNVRCIELHTYTEGGGLPDPTHRDCGSILTLSVLLSDSAAVDGGHFVTWSEGEPVVHALEAGDAVLFRSEKRHNVQSISRGTRHSLVVELWAADTNVSLSRWTG